MNWTTDRRKKKKKNWAESRDRSLYYLNSPIKKFPGEGGRRGSLQETTWSLLKSLTTHQNVYCLLEKMLLLWCVVFLFLCLSVGLETSVDDVCKQITRILKNCDIPDILSTSVLSFIESFRLTRLLAASIWQKKGFLKQKQKKKAMDIFRHLWTRLLAPYRIKHEGFWSFKVYFNFWLPKSAWVHI